MEKESCYFFFNKGSNSPSKMVGSSSDGTNPTIEIAMRDRANSIFSNQSNENSSSNNEEVFSKSKKPDQQNQSSNFEMMSEKNFFHLLKDYMAQVDSYLKTVVCTYYNILKNCLLQSINSEGLSP
jgi:hypothetical protein